MHLPIKTENKVKMPVSATTVLLLLIYFYLSVGYGKYLIRFMIRLCIFFSLECNLLGLTL